MNFNTFFTNENTNLFNFIEEDPMYSFVIQDYDYKQYELVEEPQKILLDKNSLETLSNCDNAENPTHENSNPLRNFGTVTPPLSEPSDD